MFMFLWFDIFRSRSPFFRKKSTKKNSVYWMTQESQMEECSVTEIPLIDLRDVSEDSPTRRTVLVEVQRDQSCSSLTPLDLSESYSEVASQSESRGNSQPPSPFINPFENSLSPIRNGFPYCSSPFGSLQQPMEQQVQIKDTGKIDNAQKDVQSDQVKEEKEGKEKVKTVVIPSVDANCILTVCKYFLNIQDFKNIEKCCKKYRGTVERFRENPFDFSSLNTDNGKLQRKLFRNTQTRKIYNGIGNDSTGVIDEVVNVLKHESIPNDISIHVDGRSIKRIIVIPEVSYDDIYDDYIPNDPKSISLFADRVNAIKDERVEYKSIVGSLRDGIIEQVTKLTSINPDYDNAANKDIITITIPDFVLELANNTFRNNLLNNDIVSKIQNIRIPNSVTEIGKDCFYNCNNMTAITLPNGIKRLRSGTFSKCSNLISITIPDNVTKIGKCCFEYCSSLNRITFSSDLKIIGSHAFWRCVFLDNLLFPGSLKVIGSNAFEFCESLQNLFIDHTIDIGPTAFADCTSLSAIEIRGHPNGINENMFYQCSKLISISLPSSINTIKANTFILCSTLSRIDIPHSVTSLGDSCFLECTNLLIVNLPVGIQELQNSCFEKCSNLVNINLPTTITLLGNSCFSNCTTLKEIDLPTTIHTLGNSCFESCSRLSRINEYNLIGGTFDTLPDSIFSNCLDLKNIVLNPNIVILKDTCFYKCSNLEGIWMTSNVISIGNSCMGDCTSLISLVLIGRDDNQVGINLPYGISGIKNSTFTNCSSIKDVKINSPLEYISYDAFSSCTQLTSINISRDTVRFIYDDAFTNTPVLDHIPTLGFWLD